MRLETGSKNKEGRIFPFGVLPELDAPVVPVGELRAAQTRIKELERALGRG